MAESATKNNNCNPNIQYFELVEILAPLQKWEDFVHHLPGELTLKDFKERKFHLPGTKPENNDHEENDTGIKHAFLSKWLCHCLDATWEDVITALEKAGEHDLAKKVKEKHSSPTEGKMNNNTRFS